MATSIVNQDGTLTVTLTTTKQGTMVGLPQGQFDGYLTQWLADHAAPVFVKRFAMLSDVDKADVMTKMQAAEVAEKG